jgi:hypothetical protein
MVKLYFTGGCYLLLEAEHRELILRSLALEKSATQGTLLT